MVGIKKSIRLEGLVYGKGFELKQVITEFREEQKQRDGESAADRAREYERVSGVFENIISDRAKFNQGRYGKDAPRNKAKQSRLREEVERSEPRATGERRETQTIITRELNHSKSNIKDKLTRSDQGNHRELQSSERESQSSARERGDSDLEKIPLREYRPSTHPSNRNTLNVDRVETKRDTHRLKQSTKRREPRRIVLPRKTFERIYQIKRSTERGR